MMTHQLIIDDRPADLGDVSITLEYVSNLFGDPGKINLSRSYTVSLPKTRRNAAILDHPGAPAHASGMARRYFSARYIRNGIDLLGEARAYLLRSTDDAYEVALVWSTLEGLQELSQSKATLNDLPDLPVLRWIGPNGTTPDYTGGDNAGGALHAWYNCGIAGTSDPKKTNAATHPCMKVSELFGRVLDNAGIPWALHSEKAGAAMSSQCVLAAPSAKPSVSLDIESGTVFHKPRTAPWSTTLVFFSEDASPGPDTTSGWDPVEAEASVSLEGETVAQHRILLNLAPPAEYADTFARIGLNVVSEGDQIMRVPYNGEAYVLDTVIDVRGLLSYSFVFDHTPATGLPMVTFSAYDPALPPARICRVHEGLNIAKDNRFPLEGNLPDVGQWEFVKACAALYGLVPIIRGDVLHFHDYDGLLDLADAYDWSAKVDQPRDGMPDEVAFTVSGWTQDNAIVWAKDKGEPLPFDPDVHVEVEDATLKASRDWLKLPFAASNGPAAIHYQAKEDGTVETLDMEPRIFSFGLGLNGVQLSFPAAMYGEGLKAAYYGRVQEIMRRPVSIVANIRLHEIDLATLDLARPVYLRQFGGYFAITKIQTSDSDLCKVELIKLP